MFRFNLKDLIWLTIVVALMLVIFINMFAFRQKKSELNEQLIESKLQTEQLQARLQALEKTIAQGFQNAQPVNSKEN